MVRHRFLNEGYTRDDGCLGQSNPGSTFIAEYPFIKENDYSVIDVSYYDGIKEIQYNNGTSLHLKATYEYCDEEANSEQAYRFFPFDTNGKNWAKYKHHLIGGGTQRHLLRRQGHG